MGLFGFGKRGAETNHPLDQFVAGLCGEAGMPNTPFDVNAAVRQVLAGTRPGVPRDGKWWFAMGVEQVGAPKRSRLLEEGAVPTQGALAPIQKRLFDAFGGRALMPPHLEEGRFIGAWKGDQDIIHVRVTGRMRPLGGWLVAVPPWRIGSKR